MHLLLQHKIFMSLILPPVNTSLQTLNKELFRKKTLVCALAIPSALCNNAMQTLRGRYMH
jgi:hypothetical protein